MSVQRIFVQETAGRYHAFTEPAGAGRRLTTVLTASPLVAAAQVFASEGCPPSTLIVLCDDSGAERCSGTIAGLTKLRKRRSAPHRTGNHSDTTQTTSPDLLTAGKHLAVKLAEMYRAAGANPADCQAVRDWLEAVKKAEGRS